MDRWNTSWRFYVERPVSMLDRPDQFGAFQRQPGPHFCLMLERDTERLAAAGYQMRIERRARGLFTTSGRALSRHGRANWQTFVIVTDESRGTGVVSTPVPLVVVGRARSDD